MFTGIVSSTGRLADTTNVADGRSLAFELASAATIGWRVGDSIAVAGVCLTIEQVSEGRFCCGASPETLARTTLGGLAPGDRVNLELPLAAGDVLGGHFVTGHIDGVAQVDAIEEAAGSLVVAVSAPAELARFIAPRGSVALDGVSLTVNDAAAHRFRVTVVPHTRRVTTLGSIRRGQGLNLEIDLVARYLARLVDAQGPS